MIHFALLTPSGHVVETGYCDESLLELCKKPGLTLVTSTEEIKAASVNEPADDWSTARRKAYPSLRVFADAYYWEQKGDKTKMKAYIDAVDAVKAKYPKPT